MIGFVFLLGLSACDKPSRRERLQVIPVDNEKITGKKFQNNVKDSLKSSNFTNANTSGNFSKGQGSEKKKSTEKPNRNRVLQDFTHPFQTPVEFVDETSDPAFNYTSPNECEIILADTLH